MIDDLLLDSDLAEPASDIHPDFAQRHPLQIAVCLRKLVSGGDFGTAEFHGRQIVTQVLEVDSRNARFIFDAGSVAADNRTLSSAKQLMFRSLPGGIRVEFTAHAAEAVVFEGRLAFEAPLPAVLYYVQRREYFRVQTPALDPYVVSGRYVGGDPFKVEMQDLSLGGVALRTANVRFGSLEAGCVLQDVILQLGDFGTLRLDLKVVAPPALHERGRRAALRHRLQVCRAARTCRTDASAGHHATRNAASGAGAARLSTAPPEGVAAGTIAG